MTGWHEGAMAGFDLETTGPDPETARIVTAAVVVRGGAEEAFTGSWLSDVGGQEIPEGAAKVHGITTDRARAEGLDAQLVVDDISSVLARYMAAGVPVVIYNAAYDLTVLDRETRRHRLEPFAAALARSSTLIVDPFVLDKQVDRYRKGSRSLTATCAHYRVALDGAHDATADALAAMRVAWRIGCRYPAIAALAPAELHDLQAKARAEQSRGLEDYFRRQGKPETVDGQWPYLAFTGATS